MSHEAAKKANNTGRLREEYELLRPLADQGDVDASSTVGSYMVHGLHRFETIKEFEKWCQDHANDDPPVELSPSEDVQQGLDFLAHAAEGRNWPAAHNLSVYYCTKSLTHDPEKWKYYLELSDSIWAEWNDKPKDGIG